MPLHFINGEFTRGGATEEIEVHDPATEEVIDTVPRGTAGDAESVVNSSKDACGIIRFY